MPRWIVFAAALLLPPLAAAQVNAIPSAPHLLVKGHAEGHYVPDRFTVSLQVEETDMVPDLARKKVEAHMAQILASLDSTGALRGKTSASSLKIEPQNEYRDGRSVFIGTQVSRGVHATFSDLDKLRGFIGQLKARGGADLQRRSRAQRCRRVATGPAQTRDGQLAGSSKADRRGVWDAPQRRLQRVRGST